MSTVKYDVIIASPGSDFVGAYVKSLADTFEECHRQGFKVKWVNGQSSLVHHARELTASGGESRNLNPEEHRLFGGLPYKRVVWIDSDISWRPDQFMRLIKSPYEVVTGAYAVVDGSTSILTSQGFMTRQSVKQEAAPFRVDACGFGFVSMKQGVFERMPRAWFCLAHQQVGVLNGHPVIDSAGEDISWCSKARGLGIEIWFDPTILVTHHKVMPLTI